ncbi:hypothetical protein M0Q50_10045 [bacterium]|jgi:predicted metal-dependent peptidase|nr:hypothetical protein [bacterium]
MLKNYKMFVESIDNGGSSTAEYDDKAWRKFKRALTQLQANHPFFSDVLYKMTVLMSYKIPTMATDGRAILFNPKFLTEELLEKEAVFVIAHEVMHVILNHMKRLGKKDSWIWNCAGDYAINILLDDGETQIGKRPAMALYESKYKNLSTDVIYDKLVEEGGVPPKPENGDDGEQEPYEPEVGDYIKLKKQKDKFGKITKIYADGSYEYDEVTKADVDVAMKQ